MKLLATFLAGLVLGVGGSNLSTIEQTNATLSAAAFFTDIRGTEYFDADGSVREMVAKGIIKGYDDGRFGGGDFVTRGQAVVMLTRYHHNVIKPLQRKVDFLLKHLDLGECGNGIKDVGEQCDDGNRDDGDGCSSECLKEQKPRPIPVPSGKCAPCENRCLPLERVFTMDCKPTTEEFECVYEDGKCHRIPGVGGEGKPQCPEGQEPEWFCTNSIPPHCSWTCSETPQVCPQDAKLCPDGSAVGRNSELNCAFDPCPSPNVSCDEKEQELADTFRSSRACRTADDCAVLVRGCSPYLTCGKPVNKASLGTVKEAIADYIRACLEEELRMCAMCVQRGAVCDKGFCRLDPPDAPVCGNGICEAGEEDVSDPGGCGPNADPRCLGPPASYREGTCPEDCFVPEKVCATYYRFDGPKEHCAKCGDGRCDAMENCISSNCTEEVCTDDCGPLYCPNDCEDCAYQACLDAMSPGESCEGPEIAVSCADPRCNVGSCVVE